MAGNVYALVGAPRLEAYAPPSGTIAASFQEWVEGQRVTVLDVLERAVARWQPLALSVVINFVHPVVGPAGAIVVQHVRGDPRRLRRRADRLVVIPFVELTPYLTIWKDGGSVVTHVDEMPDALARRYAATPIRWSANHPLHVEGHWVGLVGAATGERGFSTEALDGFAALGRLLTADFEAYRAWRHFREIPRSPQRALRLLP